MDNCGIASGNGFLCRERIYPLHGTHICVPYKHKPPFPIVGAVIGRPENIPLSDLGLVAMQAILDIPKHYAAVTVDHWVVMPNHIHLLITIHDRPPGTSVRTRTSEIARFVGTFKRFCNKEYGSNIWQSRYYDHVIRNQQDYNEVWEYIENNPTKWVTTKDII